MITKQNMSSLTFSYRRLFFAFLSLHLLAFSGLVQSAIFTQDPILDGSAGGVRAFTPEEVAGDFIIDFTAKVLALRWSGSFGRAVHVPSADNIFTVRFYENNGNLPATNPFQSFENITATRTKTGFLNKDNKDIFRFDASLTPFILPASIDPYYVSIMHIDKDDEYFWIDSDSSGSFFFQNSTAIPPEVWSEVTGKNNLAFTLIPEPTTTVLFLFALLLFTFHRRIIKT